MSTDKETIVDYTKDFVYDDEVYVLELDDQYKYFIDVKKYAGKVTILTNPTMIKIFGAENIVNFGIWTYLCLTTSFHKVDEFMVEKFSPLSFLTLAAIYANSNEEFCIMIKDVYRIYNPIEYDGNGNVFKYASNKDIVPALYSTIVGRSEYFNDAPCNK